MSITSCEWGKNPASKLWYKSDEITCSKLNIQDSIVSGELFGIVKCNLRVPDNLIKQFSEFPPYSRMPKSVWKI